jgi:hypothetical protein
MSGSVQKGCSQLGQEVAEAQTRIFLRLVFDILEVLEKYDQCSLTANDGPQIAKRETDQRVPQPEGIL